MTTAWTKIQNSGPEIRRSELFIIDPYKANNPKNDNYYLNEQATPTSLEIEEVSIRLRFVLRGNEGYLRRELRYNVINSCFRENLVQIYF